jgi:hypothetical protein
MKTKFLLTAVILFFVAFTANAQIDKGAVLLGGGVSYYSYKSDQPNYYYANSQNKSVGANIQIGKAVNKNDVAGLILSYNYNKVNAINYPDSNAYKNNQYGVGIFYRKYKKLLKDFYFFGEIDGEYTHSENLQQNLQNGADKSKTTSDGGRISFVPGLSYQLCKMMQVELTMQNIVSASYVHFKTNYANITIPPGPYKGNNFSFNANLNSGFLSNFGIGFKFLLGK